MARQTIASEFNSFVGGLITEASPLTFPGNAALDITNFNINKDGTISRRLGMDFEANHTVIDSGVSPDVTGEVAINTTTWVNAGGDPRATLVVVQTGNVLKFYDCNANSVTSNLIHTHTFSTIYINIKLSAAVVDGVLVVVGAGKQPSSFSYKDGVITENLYSLKIRDVFGVEALGVVSVPGETGPFAPVDLRTPANINLRPDAATVPDTHIYNLRNSTYALSRMTPEGLTIEDPIKSFAVEQIQIGTDEFDDPIYDTQENQLPSNADSVTSALFADAEQSADRLTERFHPKVLRRSPRGNFESPIGYFIIDALERGTSRLNSVEALDLTRASESSEYQYEITTLPLDRTPGGASAVGEYAGRVWYAGFSGEVVEGDSYSPNMSSHILFSKLVATGADLGTCHQIGDPTSKESPDLLETDGGFIRLDEAFGINRLINIGSGLVVVAENGVWFVSGGSDFGFTATTYKVSKVTSHGCTSPDSVVLVDDSVMYWSDDGIYQVSSNELGDLKATNITTTTIQKLYDSVSDLKKTFVQGHFDTYDRKVRWIYRNLVSPVEDTGELILDVALGAFYKHEIPTTTSKSPNIVALVEVPPFKAGEVTENVTDSGVLVLDSGVQVTDTTTIVTEGLRELLYLTLIDTSPTVTYTMSKYGDSDFIDWKSYDDVGVDSPALLITGYNGGGDYQRNKQTPYVTFHFEKTEDGFYTDELGDIYPTHESSCKVQAQWEWANSAMSGRWGKEFQAYRHKRAYIPESAADGYDNGFSVVTTKNRLRGKGKVLSLQLKTEPLKDCKLLGWSTITSVASNV